MRPERAKLLADLDRWKRSLSPIRMGKTREILNKLAKMDGMVGVRHEAYGDRWREAQDVAEEFARGREGED